MEYPEEACFVYGAGDLFKVHHVMTAATFGGEEAVLNCMCGVLVRMSCNAVVREHKCRLLTDKGKASTYEASTSGFGFSSDVTRITLMRC